MSTLAGSGSRSLARTVTEAGEALDGLGLLTGTVISVAATTARVDDAFGRQIQGIPLVPVIVGQTVWVLRSGTTNLILGTGTNTGELARARLFALGGSDATNTGLRDLGITVGNAVVSGWVEATVTIAAGFSAANLTGVAHLLYTNSTSRPIFGGAVQTALQPIPGVAITSPAVASLDTLGLVYPTTAGANADLAHRLVWNPNAQTIWWDGYMSVREYAG